MLNLANVPASYRLRWDHRDMIQSVDLGGGGRAYYNYDAAKERTRKVVVNTAGTGRWERLYLGGAEVYRRYESDRIVEEIETHPLVTGDRRVLIVEDVLTSSDTALREGPRVRYQLTDHLGSSCTELDEEAGIITCESYHPYGTSAYCAGRSAAEVRLRRYRYTGKERDSETGLNYHSARYYATWLGGWVSADPSGLADGLALYRYARGNPVKYVDRNGRTPTVVPPLGPGPAPPPPGPGVGIDLPGTRWGNVQWGRTPPPQPPSPGSPSLWGRFTGALAVMAQVSAGAAVAALAAAGAVILYTPSRVDPGFDAEMLRRFREDGSGAPHPISAPPPVPPTVAVDPRPAPPAQAPPAAPPNRAEDPTTHQPVRDPVPVVPYLAGSRRGPSPGFANINILRGELRSGIMSVFNALIAQRKMFSPSYPANILIGGAYSEIAGTQQRVITVSHPVAWDVLNAGYITLPPGFEFVGPRPPAGRSLPLPLHVERIAPAIITSRGIVVPSVVPVRGLVDTSSPTCRHCSRVWQNGVLFRLWQHQNWVSF